MQEFLVTVKVVINTLEDVTSDDVSEAFDNLLDTFDGGPCLILSVKEIA